MKRCSTCKVEKHLSDFGKESRRSDGISGRCKACMVKKAMTWNNTNGERKNANNRSHAARHRAKYAAYCRQWRAEYGKAYERERYKRRKHIVRASAKKYKADKLRACPQWANLFFIQEAYHLAAVRTKHTGYQWHVDHIVPLRSKSVCGLHVEHNLQVIPAAVNLRKQNFYWPDMPEAA